MIAFILDTNASWHRFYDLNTDAIYGNVSEGYAR